MVHPVVGDTHPVTLRLSIQRLLQRTMPMISVTDTFVPAYVHAAHTNDETGDPGIRWRPELIAHWDEEPTAPARRARPVGSEDIPSPARPPVSGERAGRCRTAR